jgi:hypothetical protein
VFFCDLNEQLIDQSLSLAITQACYNDNIDLVTILLIDNRVDPNIFKYYYTFIYHYIKNADIMINKINN